MRFHNICSVDALRSTQSTPAPICGTSGDLPDRPAPPEQRRISMNCCAKLLCGNCRGRSRDRDLNSPVQSLHKLRYSGLLQGHSEQFRRDRRYSRATHDSGIQPVASFSLKLKEQVSPTVVSHTHVTNSCFFLVQGWGLEFKTHQCSVL